jgi:hypothetical protein
MIDGPHIFGFSPVALCINSMSAAKWLRNAGPFLVRLDSSIGKAAMLVLSESKGTRKARYQCCHKDDL